MARIRTLKPELPTDADLASVSIEARYTLILLITQADDFGFVRARARQLLGALFPHEEHITTEILMRWITELVGIGVVRWRETTDGQPVLELVNWSKHQKVDKPSQPRLRDALLPIGEPSEESSRDLREPSEEKYLADLGPRTLDLGPTACADKPRKEPKLPKPPKPVESWVTAGVEIWAEHVGIVDEETIRDGLKKVVGREGEDRTLVAFRKYAEHRQRVEAAGDTPDRFLPGIKGFAGKLKGFLPKQAAAPASAPEAA